MAETKVPVPISLIVLFLTEIGPNELPFGDIDPAPTTRFALLPHLLKLLLWC
jgi:hypothetical protein